MCLWQVSLLSRFSPGHSTSSVWGSWTLLMWSGGHVPLRVVNVMRVDLDPLASILHFALLVSWFVGCVKRWLDHRLWPLLLCRLTSFLARLVGLQWIVDRAMAQGHCLGVRLHWRGGESSACSFWHVCFAGWIWGQGTNSKGEMVLTCAVVQSAAQQYSLRSRASFILCVSILSWNAFVWSRIDGLVWTDCSHYCEESF
jgi:hypothetical protein